MSRAIAIHASTTSTRGTDHRERRGPASSMDQDGGYSPGEPDPRPRGKINMAGKDDQEHPDGQHGSDGDFHQEHGEVSRAKESRAR